MDAELGTFEEINATEIITYYSKELEGFKAENAKLKALVEQYEKRLEIDSIYIIHKGKGSTKTIPPEDRPNQIDGISCRNETISGLEEQIKELKAQLAQLKADNAKWRIELLKEV